MTQKRDFERIIVCDALPLMGRPGPERQIMKIRCSCLLFFPYCETFQLFPGGETEMLLVWGQLCICSDECAAQAFPFFKFHLIFYLLPRLSLFFNLKTSSIQKNCTDSPLSSIIKTNFGKFWDPTQTTKKKSLSPFCFWALLWSKNVTNKC